MLTSINPAWSDPTVGSSNTTLHLAVAMCAAHLPQRAAASKHNPLVSKHKLLIGAVPDPQPHETSPPCQKGS